LGHDPEIAPQRRKAGPQREEIGPPRGAGAKSGPARRR
jgi:hypothetical protein